ncbi:MAG TPA: methionyl-tRNA formyltransferase [Burkholderiaceae bacterium]|nr:methionyl-tRNA formyltransferase [Burkholderiaceae bacterium]
MTFHFPSHARAPLRVVFAGTPPFAACALKAIHAAGFHIPLVLTQPDRPAGRGLQPQPSAVKRAAVEAGIPVAQPVTLRSARKDGTSLPEGVTAQSHLRGVEHDVMVVAAYGLILPPEVLAIPRLGCLNIHASLLPRWRGAAPIQRAIEAGDAMTGITIMQMDAGLDTGPMLLDAPIPILAHDTAASLHDRLAELGARLIVEALSTLPTLSARPQPEAGVTYAAKIEKHEAAVNFNQPAALVAARIRAFNPMPGAHAVFAGRAPMAARETFKFWQAEAIESSGSAGEVLHADANGVVVACAEGAVRITELQRPGGRRLNARDFLAGTNIAPGDRFVISA